MCRSHCHFLSTLSLSYSQCGVSRVSKYQLVFRPDFFPFVGCIGYAKLPIGVNEYVKVCMHGVMLDSL